MPRHVFALPAVAFVLSLLAATDAMAALAQRTFVASSGNDANPCSLTLPCRSFVAAIPQTVAGGEVIVLDSAGYGPVTIAQSVSIIAPAGVYAGITVLTYGPGIAISGAGIKVVLRGLTINSTGGAFGIRLSNGSELTVEDCEITNFDYGILIEYAASVNISGTVLRNHVFGIAVNDGATVTIAKSQVIRSLEEGIMIYASAPGITTSIVIVDTLVTGAGLLYSTYCIDNNAQQGTGNISATRVTVTDCQWAFNNGPVSAGTMTVSNSMVTGNVYGFLRQYGTFQSLGNNHVSGNQFDTSGTITTIPPM